MSWLGLRTRMYPLPRRNLRFGQGPMAGLTEDLLFMEDIFPVCHPRLLGRRKKALASRCCSDTILCCIRFIAGTIGRDGKRPQA